MDGVEGSGSDEVVAVRGHPGFVESSAAFTSPIIPSRAPPTTASSDVRHTWITPGLEVPGDLYLTGKLCDI